jgi:hypothetical protein
MNCAINNPPYYDSQWESYCAAYGATANPDTLFGYY